MREAMQNEYKDFYKPYHATRGCHSMGHKVKAQRTNPVSVRVSSRLRSKICEKEQLSTSELSLSATESR
ncbi:hypothetical protein E2C01_025392 [Portunus trituberculatus]|uniref:Uncharacterized protein n=1 Tax=Portunus trituberculatus TaxID=210409 RepID=A0A5B7EF22_PORTR|nr:hypothetical protein [Portunus trituberculatus]